MYKFQNTISKEIIFSGIGLHSGEPVKIKLKPAKENSGIKFFYKKEKIEANWKNAEISQLCTKIKNKKYNISTIEHLMSALSATGVTNLDIETTAKEIPILDGSSKDFFEKIEEVGTNHQIANQKTVKIKKKILYKSNNRFIQIEPINSNNLIIDYTIDYNDKFIRKQNLVYTHNIDNYKKIYLARTFCLHRDLEKIFSIGLGKGGSLDNAIVVSDNRILNQGGLRYDNEFVKHKILDCIGDLYLAQHQICGKVTVYGGGHEMNLMLLEEIFKNNKNYELQSS